ncbi:hypothetical protein MMC10_003899 [Thelotrema lepadinum]|nr:hypothetical protein [Thelotrema lepadinum]
MAISVWDPPNYDCIAEIAPDSDIGGLGVVLLAFVAVSWITVIVAGVPAIYECIEKLRDSNKLCIPCLRSKQQQSTGSSSQDPERQSDAKPRPFRGIVKKCEKLLNPLSDLQAVTGISIIVAGWAQIKTISYYHQQLIMAYWWLTLNSFLTSRAEYLGFGLNSQDKKKSKGERIWAFMRIMIKLSSCVLGLSFDGFGLATWLVLVIFNIWKTYDVVSLRSVNQDIVQDKGGESRMGFGQILTLVMITSIIFNAVDIFCGKAYEDENDTSKKYYRDDLVHYG